MFTRNKLVIYLSGAIRDEKPEDILWREHFIDKLDEDVLFLNPLGGKKYHTQSRIWTLHDLLSSGEIIVPQDLWCVDRADVCIFNFNALAEGYPQIGTLTEFGRSTARSCLRYLIIKEGTKGHANTMFKLHPFLEKNASAIFKTVEECCTFLKAHVKMLSGSHPRFGGYQND